jgi:DNA-binding transcriptional MocR family regulator
MPEDYVHIDETLRPFHAKIYQAIREAWTDYGMAPSQHEMMLAAQCSSTTVQQALKELRKRGYIVAPKHGTRAARPTDLHRIIRIEPPDPWAGLQDEPEPKLFRRKVR